MTDDNPRPETWKPVRGYEGLYEVSDIGRVRSLDRTYTRCDGEVRHTKSRILRPGGRDDYLRVGLSVAGKLDMRKVHLLVAEAFISARPALGMVCRHLNDIKTDNRVSNLAWGTASDNQRDSVRNRTHRASKKDRCVRGHMLVCPNLDGDSARVGRRRCRSCTNARKSLRRRLSSYTELQAQALADEKYAALGLE